MDLFTKKENLKIIFSFIWVIGLSTFVKGEIVEPIRYTSGILIGISAVFFVGVFVQNILNKTNSFFLGLKKDFKNKISESINEEIKAKTYEKKLALCKEREDLYDRVVWAGKESLFKPLFLSFISFLGCLFLILPPIFLVPYVHIPNYQIGYFLLIFGTYFLIKSLLIILEFFKIKF